MPMLPFLSQSGILEFLRSRARLSSVRLCALIAFARPSPARAHCRLATGLQAMRRADAESSAQSCACPRVSGGASRGRSPARVRRSSGQVPRGRERAGCRGGAKSGAYLRAHVGRPAPRSLASGDRGFRGSPGKVYRIWAGQTATNRASSPPKFGIPLHGGSFTLGQRCRPPLCP